MKKNFRRKKPNKNCPLERQVCTLEQAKKFREILGEDAPESLWVWSESRYQKGMWLITEEDYESDIVIDTIQNKKVHLWYTDEYYPAYTGDEIGALLPHKIKTPLLLFLKHSKYEGAPYLYGSAYWDIEAHCVVIEAKHPIYQTEAQAKAALAIQGLTDGWIKKEEFNYEKEL